MIQPEGSTRQSACIALVHILAFLLLISLNGLPYFIAQWAQKLTGDQTSSVVFQPILLQWIDDCQESLICYLKSVFDKFVFDVLSREDEVKSRRLIAKADSVITVVRVFAVKLPSVGVTLLLVIPKTMLSTLSCVLAAGAWYLVFFDAVRTAQNEKSDRNTAVSDRDSDAEVWQERYLRSLSGLFARLLSWSVIRSGCFAEFCPGLDLTLTTRFVHQVAALEKVMLKLIQSSGKAQKIVKVLMNKRPSQRINRLRAASNRICVLFHSTVLGSCCTGKLHGKAWKHAERRPLLPITDRTCHESRLVIYYTVMQRWVAEKFEQGSLTMRSCLQHRAIDTVVQETRPLLDANLLRYASAIV
ncbi:hypothetical protein BDP55DRAFT_638807 [Colletotrichum godetiae]|uniref:Uncharacterized protein n=1 Tax=Colletotrichum godetiae TaxID=1209918 RepID=A0AAJ0EQ87_9PEZI|nr:uncharacterized protein BDP55DRAFT_638807 [Colletotrichum godetiae]KAK1657349.1 hypothetical protein BDP55DRAFT_638807 [Colletotrichum godetiae]